ncbi:MAG: ABC transporter substrate-binding protein [Dehalococcoidales bacterium]
MKKNFTMILVSCLIALSFVVVACGQAADTDVTRGPGIVVSEEEKEKEAVEEEEKEAVEEEEEEEVVDPTRPRYGGTITVRTNVDPSCCDSAAGHMMAGALILGYSHEQLLDFDWARGKALGGTGEFDVRAVSAPEGYMGPGLVESVEITAPGVWVFQVRQNMHWQPVDNPGGDIMGGRLVTMDDILSSYDRMIHGEGSAMQRLQPRVANAMVFEQTGPWELTVLTPVQPITAQWWVLEGGGFAILQPTDIIEQFGNIDDWRMQVGTGPWMLTDYVASSQATYIRNPIYYLENPIGPGKGDQLPYADKLRRLVIPDGSTTFAALRTGKLDVLGGAGVPREDALQIISTAPGIEYNSYLPSGFGAGKAVNFNFTDPTKPWALTDNGRKVRQALMLATDYDSIVNDLYDGEAQMEMILTDPNFEGVGYVPLDELDQSVQDLFSYDVAKAKALMAEAGYPDGFKAKVLVPTVPGVRADEVSLLAGMWDAIGVELDIEVTDATALTSMVTRTFDWDDMIYGTAGTSPGSFAFSLYTYVGYYRGDNRLQFASRLDENAPEDPIIEGYFDTMSENLYTNWPAVYEAVEQLRPYLIEQAFKIPFPTPLVYTLWWPWLKNTGGMGEAGVNIKYFWVDQDLKKSMGY